MSWLSRSLTAPRICRPFEGIYGAWPSPGGTWGGVDLPIAVHEAIILSDRSAISCGRQVPWLRSRWQDRPVAGDSRRPEGGSDRGSVAHISAARRAPLRTRRGGARAVVDRDHRADRVGDRVRIPAAWRPLVLLVDHTS